MEQLRQADHEAGSFISYNTTIHPQYNTTVNQQTNPAIGSELDGAKDPGDVYYENKVKLIFRPSGSFHLLEASFTITSLSITGGQDPFSLNRVGDTREPSLLDGTVDFIVGRKGSVQVADWWKNRIPGRKTTFNHDPGKLNFGFIGTLSLRLATSVDGENSEDTYVMEDVGLAQGHKFLSNNWWFGGANAIHLFGNTVLIAGRSESGRVINFYFFRGGGDFLSPVNEISFAAGTLPFAADNGTVGSE